MLPKKVGFIGSEQSFRNITTRFFNSLVNKAKGLLADANKS